MNTNTSMNTSMNMNTNMNTSMKKLLWGDWCAFTRRVYFSNDYLLIFYFLCLMLIWFEIIIKLGLLH